VDPKWWYRGGLVLLVVVFIVLVARMTIVSMRPDTGKIDRAVGGETQGAAPRASP
jgi:hypothetical protein